MESLLWVTGKIRQEFPPKLQMRGFQTLPDFLTSDDTSGADIL